MYTIIFEFKGGTYCSQNYSVNEKEALLSALKNNINNEELSDFKETLLTDIVLYLEDSDIVPLIGLENIWYFSFYHEDDSYHCHIIKTVT